MELRVFNLILFVTTFGISYARSPCYQYYSTSRTTCTTGWLFRRHCRKVYSSHKECCYGYKEGACTIPRCRGGYSAYSCNVNNEGYVKHKDGTVVRNSGGYCDTPHVCKNCNKGYYPTSSNGGYCKATAVLPDSQRMKKEFACPKPANCNLPVCTDSTNTVCEYCVGEHAREKPGFNVYTGFPDNRICQRACSWTDGARCFPGTCNGDMVFDKDCKCAKGFGGHNCATANTEKMPVIKDMSVALQDSSGHKLIIDKSLGVIFWTNQLKLSKIALTASSNYQVETGGAPPNYIKYFLIGVEEMEIDLTLSRGTERSTWKINGGCTNFAANCDYHMTNFKELNIISQWQRILKGTFRHADSINISISAKNGGKVFYEDRGVTGYPERMYMLRGITTTQTLLLRFDERQPEHCFEQRNDCTKDSLSAMDFLNEPRVFVSWDGWTDPDSGVDRYEFNVYHLKTKTIDGPLTDGDMIRSVSFDSSNVRSSALLNLTYPGPYSIEIIVHDRAGNHKTSRRIILFDNASVVELYGTPSKITQANDNGWINTYSTEIEVVWPGRFRNIRHSNGGWLNAVQAKEEIQRDLDDRKGRSERTIERIDNIEGIVRFEIANGMELKGNSTFSDYMPVPEEYFHSQKMIYHNIDIEDGKKLTFSVRGVDAVGEYAEDNVTVFIDLSPPIIQNLWLTKGALVNFCFHSVLEIKDLTFEWEAFDYHSGLNEVNWKIFDNYTKNVVMHGQSHQPPQGETKTLDECNDRYGKYYRGPSCYCSPYNGCFHKHYQIKLPVIHDNSSGGLLSGKETGEHDYDYYIEVTVINNAGLTSVKHKKV